MFLNLLNRWELAELNQAEAAAALGVSERTFRRWRGRHEEEGAAGLVDRRVGKPSPRRGRPGGRSVAAVPRALPGLCGQAFPRASGEGHGFGWGYTWLKLPLQWTGVVPAPRKGAHRRKRERRPLAGMMLRQDGSRHAWLEGEPALDLIVTLDDAKGAIYSAFLVEEEGTASTYRALNEVFSQHGLPMSLYTDRGSHYFHTTRPARSTAAFRPRSAGRWRNWASSTSALSHHRRGAVRSGRSGRFRTGW